MPSIGPRVAGEADVPALVRVINRAYAVERFFKEGQRTDAGEVRARMARPGAAFLAVDDGAAHGELAAAVYVEVRGDRGYFGMLAVEPRRHGSGLGRLRVTTAETHSRAAGTTIQDIPIVKLRTELPAFYAKFGYAPYAVEPFESNAPLIRQAHVILLTKPLVPLW